MLRNKLAVLPTAVMMLAVMLLAGAAAFAEPQQQPGQHPGQLPPVQRIVGGTPVPSSSKYPWIAALLNKTTPGSALDQQMCAGTLIDSNSVLTAAHCLKNVKKTSDLRVVLGQAQLSEQSGAGATGEIRQATRIDKHGLYDSSDMSKNKYKYDVAVIKLHSSVTNITPVLLPLSTENWYEQPGKVMSIAGWGATTSEGTHTAQMRETKVTVVSDAEGTKAYPSLFVSSVMIAAGDPGKGTCRDDSGGPLFASYKGLGSAPGSGPYQYGITSFARLTDGKLVCGEDPAGYTEVNATSIRTFITTAMNQ